MVKEAAVTKTLIEIDDEYLAAAQQALGTTTKKDTVNAALRAHALRQSVTEVNAKAREVRPPWLTR